MFLLSPLLPRLNLLAMVLAKGEYGLSSDTLTLRLLVSDRVGALEGSTDMLNWRLVEESETPGARLDGLPEDVLGCRVGLMLMRITSLPSIFNDRSTSKSSDVEEIGDL